jgi:hypothetical protein
MPPGEPVLQWDDPSFDQALDVGVSSVHEGHGWTAEVRPRDRVSRRMNGRSATLQVRLPDGSVYPLRVIMGNRILVGGSEHTSPDMKGPMGSLQNSAGSVPTPLPERSISCLSLFDAARREPSWSRCS